MLRKQELAARFKACCTVKADDSEGKLEEGNPTESGKILHELGVVYMQKRYPKDKMRLRLIQSAGLIAATNVRYQSQIVDEDLEKLWSKVQARAKAKHLDYCLSKISQQIRKRVSAIRENARQTLDQLPKIRFRVTKRQARQQQTNKINKIEILQQKISTSYTEIMKNVAEISNGILGKVTMQICSRRYGISCQKRNYSLF